MHRRKFMAGASAMTAGLAAGELRAQDVYPSRPVTLINAFPPGGTADVVGRPLVAVLEPLMKQPLVIETKAGAAGQVGAQFGATAKPDGYTLLHSPGVARGLPRGRQGLWPASEVHARRFRADRALTAGPMVLLVNDQQPHKTVKDLVEDAKKRPNELIFASSGLHGALHLPMAMFLKAAGIQMKHLPTQGGGPSITALDRQQRAVRGIVSWRPHRRR